MSRGLDLLIIDPQQDFCCDDQNPRSDGKPGTLCVPGAWDDMAIRLPNLINKMGNRIRRISVTLDCHQQLHIANPWFWRNQNSGEHPDPFTIITHANVESGPWTTSRPELRSRALKYTKALESNGRYVLCIWPPHCIIGSVGNTVVPSLQEALDRWAKDNRQTINWVSKGSNPFTEHYSGIKADVPQDDDPSTQVNTALIGTLADAAELLIAGEASSHCLLNTVNDTREELGDDTARKWTLLSDCMSGIPTMRDGAGRPVGPDFDQMVKDFLENHTRLGGRVMSSTDILARVV